MIERLCIQADLPKPQIAVADTADAQRLRDGPLAEARDRLRDDRDHETCSRPAELEGVMAHELTHIVNRDVVIMTLASFFASIASMIVQFGFFFGGGYGGDSDDDDDGPSFMVVILVSLARLRRLASC